MGWQPVLTEEDAETAKDHVASIAKGLERLEQCVGKRLSAQAYADLSHFFRYAALCLGSPDYWRLCDLNMSKAVEALAVAPMLPALHGGFCGIAFASECLARTRRAVCPSSAEDAVGSGEDENADVDNALLILLETSPWRYDYDLIKGLVGYGVYFSSRLPRPHARRGLELVVRRLAETKTDFGKAASWHTIPELLPPLQREGNPNGYFNLGLAHGVPGVLVLLAIAHYEGIVRDIAGPLAHALVDWLRGVRQAAKEVGSSFPSWWMPGRPPGRSRQAWCYGDPGIAAAWLWAGMLMNHQDWQDEALDILRFSARVPEGVSGVEDAGICHGAVGLGHIYNRVFQATGLPEFEHAARRWLRIGFGYRGLHGDWGYPAYRLDGLSGKGRLEKDPWGALHGLLQGSIGIGLGYLAAISCVSPDWDRILLLSLPPLEE